MRFYGSAMRTPHVEGAFRNVLLCDAVQCEKVADGVPLRLAALHSFPMSQARQAFELASDRKRAMKVLIDFAEAEAEAL